MAFLAVIAAPRVELKGALAIDFVAFAQFCSGLSGLAEAGNRDPLHVLVLACPDAKPNPRLARLRGTGVGVGGEESVECTLNHCLFSLCWKAICHAARMPCRRTTFCSRCIFAAHRARIAAASELLGIAKGHVHAAAPA